MRDRHGLSQSSIESIAGFSAGTVSTLAVHPLDVVKTRLQVNALPRSTNSRLSSPSKARLSLPSIAVFRSLLTSEGASPLRSLYRGLTPNLVGNSLGWSLYFLWYSQAQDGVRYLRNYPRGAQLSSLDYLTASLSAGLLSTALTNPIWVIKTRMLSTSAQHQGAYPSMLFGLRAIASREGWRGYFRGLVPALAGVSHSAVYFVAYERLKASRASQISRSEPASFSPSSCTEQNDRKDDDGNINSAHNNKLSNTDYLLTSAASKILAGTLTYPHQVVRARMQTYSHTSSQPQHIVPPTTTPQVSPTPPSHPPYSSSTSSPSSSLPPSPPRLIKIVHSIWHQDGLGGFYRGLGPNLLRVVPSTCVTFLVYENVRRALEVG